jgi:hypothetical protein
LPNRSNGRFRLELPDLRPCIPAVATDSSNERWRLAVRSWNHGDIVKPWCGRWADPGLELLDPTLITARSFVHGGNVSDIEEHRILKAKFA